MSNPINKLTVSVVFLAALSLFFFTTSAQAQDTDRDGLSDKREKKIRTNPRKADTDRDALRDGREVKKTRTNPRKADTDGDGVKDGREVEDGLDPRDADSDDDGTSDIYERKGKITQFTYGAGDPLVTVQTKRGTIFQVRVDEGTFLEGLDRDGDALLTLNDFQIGDRVEVNLDPDNMKRAQTLELHIEDSGLETKGRIVALDEPNVTVANKEGETTFVVDIDTFLRAPDRDGSGTPSFGDLEIGDKIEAYLSEDGTKALALKVEYDDDYGDDDGYDEPGESLEAEGLVESIEGDAIVLVKKGYARTITVDETTFYVGPDRNSDGEASLADVKVGDKVDARIRPDTDTVAGLKFEGKSEAKPPLPPGETKKEIEGEIVSIFPGTETMPPAFAIAKPMGAPLMFIVAPDTVFEVFDRNGDGEKRLNDLLPGDRVKVKFLVPSGKLLKVELEETDSFDD